MSAILRCGNCNKPVLNLDPMSLLIDGVASIITDAWEAHQVDCHRTCPFCHAQTHPHPKVITCGSQQCRTKLAERKTADRIADIETLLVRTSDAAWIADQVGLGTVHHLRAWLRRHGRCDLVDGKGPLAAAEGCGVAV